MADVVGPLFLEGSNNMVWEIMLEIDDVAKEVRPVGCRDARTQRKPSVYPDPGQVQYALELQKWAALNDPDVPEPKPWGNPWDKPRAADDDMMFGRN